MRCTGLAILFLLLGACTQNVKESSSEDIRVDGLTNGTPQSVARIMIKTWKKNPKNMLEVLWTARIISLDGQALPKNKGTEVLQMEPGKHTIAIAYTVENEFEPNPKNRTIKSTCQIKNMELDAGKLYYINTVTSHSPETCSIKYGETEPMQMYRH